VLAEVSVARVAPLLHLIAGNVAREQTCIIVTHGLADTVQHVATRCVRSARTCAQFSRGATPFLDEHISKNHHDHVRIEILVACIIVPVKTTELLTTRVATPHTTLGLSAHPAVVRENAIVGLNVVNFSEAHLGHTGVPCQRQVFEVQVKRRPR